MPSTLSAGSRLGRYEIRSQLGKGGMGDVYLARDRTINRDVALKILPQNFAADRERLQRFRQEAHAAASLNHPNIAHIYEIGEDDGIHFISMEFIDGMTLRDLIHVEQEELPKLLRHLQHVAEGLAKAHAAGVVHRDLKPENIMINRDGFAKLLDFGLAKLTEHKTWSSSTTSDSDVATVLENLSRSGVILGTVGYMSPEQAQGLTEKVGHRSDIFSFGCIMFEAITRKRAFQGEDAIDSLNKIIREPAPSIAAFCPDAPLELQKIVRRCLEKNPEDRYQSIKDVAIELKDIREELIASGVAVSIFPSTDNYSAYGRSQTTAASTTAGSTNASSAEFLVSGMRQHKKVAIALVAFVLLGLAGGIYGVRSYLGARNAAAPIDSIAVLPFVNQNEDPEMEYQSDGLTESIINSLAQVPNVRVIARSSAFRFKGKETDPLKAGKELGVSAVLTGRIMQRGDMLTVSTELLDVRDNQQLWGEQYTQKVSDLVAMQRAIATQITSNLRLQLSAPDQSRIAMSHTENAEAYQLYLKGRFHWNKRTGESLEKAVDYFNQAIGKDPGYAQAYVGLADAWFSRGWYRFVVPKEAYERARAAATKALEIDRHLGEAHAMLAAIKTTYEWDWQGAEREFKLAIELNPNYPTARQRYSLFLPVFGRFDEAVLQAKKARELDPLSLPANENVGDILYLARRYEEATQQLHHTLELDPNYAVAHGTLAKIYEAKGMYKEALDERLKGAPAETVTEMKKLFAAEGMKGVWRQRLAQSLERAKREYVSPADIALFYARLHERDQAFAWLEKALEERSILFNYLVADARFDNLRSDPRFAKLLNRVGLQPLRME